MDNKTDEIIEITVAKKLYYICTYCYQKLGWQIIGCEKGLFHVKFKMRRNKKLNKRTDLWKLQNKCEDVLFKLENLKSGKIVRQNICCYYDELFSACEEADFLLK